MDAKRPPSEFPSDEYEKIKIVHADFIKRHEAYTVFLSEEEYPEEDDWMEECSFKFVHFSIRVNDYAKVTPSMFKRKMRNTAQPAVNSSRTMVHKTKFRRRV